MAIKFRHCCFISYRHADEDEKDLQRFLQEFCIKLRQFVGLNLPEDAGNVYLDVKRNQPGFDLNNALAQAICNSVCMVSLYTARYFSTKHTYTAREYKAMMHLETERRQGLQDQKIRLIIPIVLGMDDRLPQEISGRVFASVSKYFLTTDRKNRDRVLIVCAQKVVTSIRSIYEQVGQLSDPFKLCNQFDFPTNQEVLQWLEHEDLKPAPPKPPV